MKPTKHEGLYYRKNKRNKKVFYARFKIDKKAYLRKLGEEPQMNTNKAVLARAELIGSMKGHVNISESKDINTWLEEYAESRRTALSDSWYYNLRKNYKLHLKDEIGSVYPTRLKISNVQTIINNMLNGNNAKGKKYAPSTVKQIKDCMSGMYLFMIKSGLNVPNLGRELQIPSFDNKVYFTISDEQATILFDKILNYSDFKWRAYFIWLLHGRRKMETAAMRWEWVDFNSMTYRIPAEISKTSRDVIAPITDLLKEALDNYGIKPLGFVFPGQGDSGHISPGGIDFQWRNIRAEAGMHKMRLHDIRHLIGFIGVNNGYSLEMIGAVLGHTSTVTTKRYSNLKSEAAKDVLSSMFDKFVKNR